MRVQLIAKAGPGTTGTSRYAEGLLGGLQAAGAVVELTHPVPARIPGPIATGLKRLGLDVEAFLRSYPLRARLDRADVYHIASQTLATLLCLQRFPAPVVVSVLDIIPHLVRGHPELDTSRHALDRLFYRLALAGLRRASALVAISEYTKRTLVEALGLAEKRIHVVYPAVDRERFRPVEVPQAFRARYGLGEEGRYVLYVGSEDPRKNLGTLVQAIGNVRQGIPAAKLVKVGAPHSQEGRQRLLAQVEDLGLKEDVLFYDSIPDGDLPLFYGVADVLAMPSLYEGFGLPVLEAMACGTPVVCSDAASLPEVAGGATWVLEPNDVTGWGEAIVAVLQDASRRKELRQAGLERVRAFSWTEAGQRTMEVYRRVAGGQGAEDG